MKYVSIASIALAFGLSRGVVAADDSATKPRNTPLTRPEMKQYIEDMKQRKPRIPLPELTDEEKAKLAERGGDRGGVGGGYEGRLRTLYTPGGEGRGDFGFGGGAGGNRQGGSTDRPRGSGGTGRESESNMTLDYKFKTQLFWIVSRTNNCQYCLGHQEAKLLAAGMTEDEIASLDFDWSQFEPAEQAAFAFARKFTYEPHRLSDGDIDGLRKYYSDLQILEMIQSMAGNNSINRWKEGVGVPQSENGGGFGRRTDGELATEATPRRHSYLTPTSEGFQKTTTKVASIVFDREGSPTRTTVFSRPPLESRDQVERALADCRARKPRLPLVEPAAVEPLMPEGWSGPAPQWARLMANFSTAAKGRIASIVASDTRGDLSPLLKAQVSWVIARQDRAWYATGLAKQRLRGLGQTDDQIYRLDGDWSDFSDRDRAMFTVARKLAASPVVLTDADVDEAVKLAGPRDVVQLINYVTNRASFDRITESAGLALEQ